MARQISSGNVAIILQDVASTWSYPMVSVTDFMATYGINDNYADNWTIGFSTDLSDYTNMDTVPDQTVLGGLVRSTVSGNSYFTGNVGIGTTTPNSKLQVAGGIKCGDDTAAASANKVGTIRYRATANASYVEMCMQVGASSYSWVAIVTNTW